MNAVDFVQMLLVAPIELTYHLIAIGVALLVGTGWLIAWLVAFFYTKYNRQWRAVLTTNHRVKVGWAWGWFVVGLLMLINLCQLVYRDQVRSLLAAAPYLIAVLVTAVLVLVFRYVVRADTKRVQRLVQGRPL